MRKSRITESQIVQILKSDYQFHPRTFLRTLRRVELLVSLPKLSAFCDWIISEAHTG